MAQRKMPHPELGAKRHVEGRNAIDPATADKFTSSKVGIQASAAEISGRWIPTFVGMTSNEVAAKAVRFVTTIPPRKMDHPERSRSYFILAAPPQRSLQSRDLNDCRSPLP